MSARRARLDAAALELSGRHLIEASAGTGKTYNITRLYIRLLVERQIPVQQILVMTFTRAATEELRGRIDRELRRAVSQWGQPGAKEEFFRQMERRVAAAQALPLLQSALLHLDEAAIFTIHGFCARVLKQHALASDMPMELEMEADTSEQALEAVSDWLRGIAYSDLYRQLEAGGWHTPEGFMRAFGDAVRSSAELLAAQPDSFLRQALSHKRELLQALLASEQEILTSQVEGHKDAARRLQEWRELIGWLSSDGADMPSKAASDFMHGRRYGKAPQLKPLLERFKELKPRLTALAAAAESAAVYPHIKRGIEDIRRRFCATKTRLGLMDFDDLITLLAERVTGPRGSSLIDDLRQQYPVALVDEFQDTDPQQYAILERVYPRREQAVNVSAVGRGAAHGTTALFMIGDPKQAIYSFRGGDIFTYLEARNGADDRWHMDTNWRSVPAMVRGYNRLFHGAPLDQPPLPVFGFDIDYETVKAASAVGDEVVTLHDTQPPGRHARRALNYVWLTPGDYEGGTVNAAFRVAMAGWCCAEIARLLEAPARVGVRVETARPLQERDIAILVRSGTEAALMQDALRDAGYPSVYLSARDNIFASPEAAELVLVLKGILALEDSRHLLAACSTSLLGGDAALLAELNSDAEALVNMRYRLLGLREQWQRQGFIAMMMALIHDWLLPPPERHERCLTNHIHLAELLQKASGNLRHPQQLLEWLQDQMQGASRVSEAELRLESDANLIRIVTQHGSKGLEYPLVFVPFANYRTNPLKHGIQPLELLRYHERHSGSARQQVGVTPQAQELAAEEAFAESIRLLYVAVTRAEQRCYLCCGPFRESATSPLARTLGFGGRHAGEPDWQALLTDLVAGEADATALLQETATPVAAGAGRRSMGQPSAVVAEFYGRIDRDWRLSSFSALTRNLSHSRRDRRDHDDDDPAGPTAAQDLPLRFRLARGAHAGNLLHDILEHTDFSAPRWREVTREPLLRFGQLMVAEQPELDGWLQDCLDTPLPAIGDGASLTLSQLGWSASLRESEFYFPMHGLNLHRLADLLRQHRGNREAIHLPGNARLRGMMHGFIDLIFECQGRFFVADYKSTHLGNRLADYVRDNLKLNNEANFYDLQYLIYALALHRYLQGRLADYDPQHHFGGVYYLYLRGMRPDSDSGVFHTAVEPQLLRSLDALFAPESRR